MESNQIIIQPTNSWQNCQFLEVENKVEVNEEAKGLLEHVLLPKAKLPSFNPMAYHLAQIEWAVFGTLTFEEDIFTKDTKEAENLRQSAFFNVLRSACIKHHLRLRNLVYFGKSEFGPNIRGHLNFLMGKYGTEKVDPAELAKSLQEFWCKGDRRRGVAKIEPFKNHWHLEGILYQSKYEHKTNGDWIPINEISSPMLQKLIRKNAQNN